MNFDNISKYLNSAATSQKYSWCVQICINKMFIETLFRIVKKLNSKYQ